jgi:hypothetical protein
VKAEEAAADSVGAEVLAAAAVSVAAEEKKEAAAVVVAVAVAAEEAGNLKRIQGVEGNPLESFFLIAIYSLGSVIPVCP